MKVEIWSDVICPWCGLGQHRLDRAIAQVGGDIELVHHSFQLDPRQAIEPMPVREMLRKKGYDERQLAGSWARIEAMAEADGLTPYKLDNVVANTQLAHEWLAHASVQGHEDAAWKRIYRAYFGEQRAVFDVDALVGLSEELGIDVTETRAALTDRRYRARVEADAREAQSLGASGVPFVVIDRRLAIAGAQPLPVFVQALQRATGA